MQQRLSLQKQQLNTALNNMTQGLVLYDASARIILCNRRYIDMYGLSTDIVRPGCHFRDLIQHRQDTEDPTTATSTNSARPSCAT